MRPLSENIKELISTFGQEQFGVTTGFPSLDSCVRGFLPGKVYVVAARSGCGKSSIMLDMALAASKEVPVAIFSIEMPFDLIQTRALANITKLNHEMLVLDKIMPMERLEVEKASQDLAKLPIIVDDKSCTMYPMNFKVAYRKDIPPDSFNHKIRKTIDDGARVIFIDYLQLVRMAGKYENEVQRLHEITWYLHTIAKEQNICVVLLSQLRRFNQDRYKEETPRPRLDDLFGSSTTENDVDVVILLHRPSYYEQKTKIDLFENRVEDDAELIIAKNRNGSTGVLSVNFLSYAMSFQDSNDAF